MSWVAILFWQGNKEHGSWTKEPALAFKVRDTYYWFGGPSHMMESDDRVKIVKRYSWGDKRQELTEKHEIQFYKDFAPVPSVPVESAGWIAPDGKFYTCQWYEHDALATRLSASIYGSLVGTKLLEELEWIRLYKDGQWGTNHRGHDLTQAQLDTLFDISIVSRGDFKEKVTMYLEWEKDK